MYPRVLIATIRDNGLYPCPRCTIEKDEIFKLGRDEDRHARQELRRVDTVERQGRVDHARKNLYNEGYALTSDYVDGFLKEESLVPTKVRCWWSCSICRTNPAAERILASPIRVWV